MGAEAVSEDSALIMELLLDERDTLEGDLDEPLTCLQRRMLALAKEKRVRLSRVNAEIARRIPQPPSLGARGPISELLVMNAP